MAAQGEIGPILRDLGMPDNKALFQKAEDLKRQMDVKIPSGSLKKAEICRSCIAVELALRMMNIDFNPANLQVHRPVSDVHYKQAFLNTERRLKLDGGGTGGARQGGGGAAAAGSGGLLARGAGAGGGAGGGGGGLGLELAVKFGGGAGAAEGARRALAAFQEKDLKAMPVQQRDYANYEKRVYFVAAFYYSMSIQKHALDKKDLCKAANVDIAEFKDVLEKIQTVLSAENIQSQDTVLNLGSSKRRKHNENEWRAEESVKNHHWAPSALGDGNSELLHPDPFQLKGREKPHAPAQRTLTCAELLKQKEAHIMKTAFSTDYLEWKDKTLRQHGVKSRKEPFFQHPQNNN